MVLSGYSRCEAVDGRVSVIISNDQERIDLAKGLRIEPSKGANSAPRKPPF